ncbi:MAG: hypothetical protein LPJ89_01775 [Hymenobacteraceae bacterium]|nr:hypothetical protein [Hymenobacteraceae bacterium]MDX5395192.1 hypothetical protein [Hymenobacteraceae bacterium]MDX5442491.1 hypothetical protein [Hymenobacteraceae bacterium]MDX5511230.1 hypothetical protein [Hymenobacteraceae bacterium]
MKFISVIIASFFGTAIMTLVLYLISFMTTRVMRVPLVLGTMLTRQTTADGGLSSSTRARFIGSVAHYVVGAIYGIVFLMMWDAEIGELTLPWAVFFGIGAGVMGIILWHLFLLVHPLPPRLPLKSYYLTLLFGHNVFSIVTFYVYSFLIENVFAP